MEIKDIIVSTKFFEFVNALDDLILEILYDTNSGYVNLSSKNAIDEAQNKIKHFDENTAKLIEELKPNNVENIIQEKRENLIFAIKQHYEEQAYIWCEEVYQDCIENCITTIAINRNNKKITDKNLQKAIAAISWIADIKKLSDNEKEGLLNGFYDELNKTIKSNDFKIQKEKIKSDEKKFLELFLKITNEDFLKINLEKYTDSLSKEDMNYFLQTQINLSTFRANSIKDENELIQGALQILNLKTEKEKYEFTKSALNDFNFFKFENKKITQEDKINLVKERIALFKDGLNYFRNKIR